MDLLRFCFMSVLNPLKFSSFVLLSCCLPVLPAVTLGSGHVCSLSLNMSLHSTFSGHSFKAYFSQSYKLVLVLELSISLWSSSLPPPNLTEVTQQMQSAGWLPIFFLCAYKIVRETIKRQANKLAYNYKLWIATLDRKCFQSWKRGFNLQWKYVWCIGVKICMYSTYSWSSLFAYSIFVNTSTQYSHFYPG